MMSNFALVSWTTAPNLSSNRLKSKDLDCGLSELDPKKQLIAARFTRTWSGRCCWRSCGCSRR